MGKALELLVREIDPRHDFDRVAYFPSLPGLFASSSSILGGNGRSCVSNLLRLAVNEAYFVVNGVKHVVRGGAAGALAGFVASQLLGSGADVEDGVRAGIAYGMLLDYAQYEFRGLFRNTAFDVVRGAAKAYSYVRRLTDKGQA